MIRQGELVTQIAREVAADIHGPWVQVVYRVKSLAPYGQEGTYVTRVTGEEQLEYPPLSVSALADELRETMYRPGSGTWFTATITIAESGSVDARL